MIRISKKADYAVYILGLLAQRAASKEASRAGSHGDLISAQELAEQTRLSKALVANLLKNLTRAGLLESVRGLRGGYRLALAPESISLARILTAVEGPFVLVTCAAHGEPQPTRADDCSYSTLCPSRNPMRAVHARIARMLEDVKLSEMGSAQALSLSNS